MNGPCRLGASLLHVSSISIVGMSKTIPLPLEIDRTLLPDDIANAFQKVGERDSPPGTLLEGFTIIEETLDENDTELVLEDLYQSKPTRHEIHLADTIKHVPCVMDAMVVALALDRRPIEIVSKPPQGGEPVRFTVTNEEVVYSPGSVVTSFGIAYDEAAEDDLEAVKDRLNETSVIPTTCSVINAFPDSNSYDRWEQAVSNAAVMELSVEQLVAASQVAAQGYLAT